VIIKRIDPGSTGKNRGARRCVMHARAVGAIGIDVA